MDQLSHPDFTFLATLEGSCLPTATPRMNTQLHQGKLPRWYPSAGPGKRACEGQPPTSASLTCGAMVHKTDRAHPNLVTRATHGPPGLTNLRM